MRPKIWYTKVYYNITPTGDGLRVQAAGKYWQDKVFDNLQTLIGHVYICINKLCAENNLKQSDAAFSISYNERQMVFGYEFEDLKEGDLAKLEELGFVDFDELD